MSGGAGSQHSANDPKWMQDIATMAFVKSRVAEVDRTKLWPYALPRVAATEQELAEVERKLGFELDAQYRAFLAHANGWPAFYQSVSLFGTPELLGDELMEHARAGFSAIEPEVLRESGISESTALPIAATKVDLDLFVITTAQAPKPGQVIWFAGSEVERFDSFSDYFLSMADYNRREYEMLSGGVS